MHVLASARSQIEIEEVQFGCGADLVANETMFVQGTSPEDPTTYQTTEVDEIWESLGNGMVPGYIHHGMRMRC